MYSWTIISVYGPDFGLYAKVPKSLLFWPNVFLTILYFQMNYLIRTNDATCETFNRGFIRNEGHSFPSF
jgi:hypothetical protein